MYARLCDAFHVRMDAGKHLAWRMLPDALVKIQAILFKWRES